MFTSFLSSRSSSQATSPPNLEETEILREELERKIAENERLVIDSSETKKDLEAVREQLGNQAREWEGVREAMERIKRDNSENLDKLREFEIIKQNYENLKNENFNLRENFQKIQNEKSSLDDRLNILVVDVREHREREESVRREFEEFRGINFEKLKNYETISNENRKLTEIVQKLKEEIFLLTPGPVLPPSPALSVAPCDGVDPCCYRSEWLVKRLRENEFNYRRLHREKNQEAEKFRIEIAQVTGSFTEQIQTLSDHIVSINS